jgi:hypothetical protein
MRCNLAKMFQFGSHRVGLVIIRHGNTTIVGGALARHVGLKADLRSSFIRAESVVIRRYPSLSRRLSFLWIRRGQFLIFDLLE